MPLNKYEKIQEIRNLKTHIILEPGGTELTVRELSYFNGKRHPFLLVSYPRDKVTLLFWSRICTLCLIYMIFSVCLGLISCSPDARYRVHLQRNLVVNFVE